MLRSSLLALAFLTLTAFPAAAQLVGNDTAPGDSCTDKPAGATRVTADADQDGKEITLICDGSVWQPATSELPNCNDDEFLIMSSGNWICYTGFPPGGTDSTPDAFTIPDLNDTSPNTLLTSNIVQITGIDTQATVTISGDGTPEFRICEDVGCTSVITDWRSGFDTITFGRYLQLRATSLGYSDAATVNYAVGTMNKTWTLTV